MRQVLHPRHRISVQPVIIALLARATPYPSLILPGSVTQEPILRLARQHVVRALLRRATTVLVGLLLRLEYRALWEHLALVVPLRQSSVLVEHMLLVEQQDVLPALLDTILPQLAHLVWRVLLRWATTVLKVLLLRLEVPALRDHLALGVARRQHNVLLEDILLLAHHHVARVLLEPILLLARQHVSRVLRIPILLLAHHHVPRVLLEPILMLAHHHVPNVLLEAIILLAHQHALCALLEPILLLAHHHVARVLRIPILLLARQHVPYALLELILILAHHHVLPATRGPPYQQAV